MADGSGNVLRLLSCNIDGLDQEDKTEHTEEVCRIVLLKRPHVVFLHQKSWRTPSRIAGSPLFTIRPSSASSPLLTGFYFFLFGFWYALVEVAVYFFTAKILTVDDCSTATRILPLSTNATLWYYTEVTVIGDVCVLYCTLQWPTSITVLETTPSLTS